jgi:hypothetical protein
VSRRRGNDNSVVVIYWRDIPAQVTAGDRETGEKVLLDARFQHAIDRAAAVAGKTDTNSYVAEWRRETTPLAGDPVAAATSRAAALEDDFPQARLEQLVRAGGLAADDAKGTNS